MNGDYGIVGGSESNNNGTFTWENAPAMFPPDPEAAQ
jgi:hypothetical protein